MNISWGKCTIFFKEFGSTGAYSKLPTPVEDSTQLTTEKGDKLEAPVEGGELEDSRTKAAKYALALAIRVAKGRSQPIPDVNGVITGNYEILLQPEDPTVPGFKMAKVSGSCDYTFTAAEGGKWEYSFDALKADGSTKLVEWGTVTEGQEGAVTFAPLA